MRRLATIMAMGTSPVAVGGPFYRTLTVDHTKVPSTQSTFPVLVSFTDATLKTTTNGGHVQNANGYDIGFYSDSALTTKLKWEVEFYGASTGVIVAWVKIATVSSSSDTVFYLRYGDATITTDQSDPVNVWSNNFIGVYHLGNGTTLSVADSLNVNNGTNTNGVTATTGQVDGGGNFASASTQYISLGTPAGNAAVTFSCWVKATSLSAAYNATLVRTGGTSQSTAQLYVKSNGKLAMYLGASVGALNYDGTGTYTLSTGTWYYITATYDSTTGLNGYVNASVDGTAGANGAMSTDAETVRIGSDATTAGREWNGVLDEVRASSVVRSADWITTEYNNQNAPGTFITVGTETVVPSGPTVVATDDFNRSDNTVLGANWTVPSSTQPSIFRITSNQCKSPTGGSAGCFWNASSFANNQYAKVKMITFSDAFNAGFGVAVRFTGTAAGDNLCGYSFYSDGNDWKIQRHDNLVLTDLATGTQSFSANDIIEIRVTGTTITGYRNGSAVSGATATDATYASGKAGLIVSNVPSVIDPICDDWEGGNL